MAWLNTLSICLPFWLITWFEPTCPLHAITHIYIHTSLHLTACPHFHNSAPRDSQPLIRAHTQASQLHSYTHTFIATHTTSQQRVRVAEWVESPLPILEYRISEGHRFEHAPHSFLTLVKSNQWYKIDTCHSLVWHYYQDRARTGRLSVRLMQLSGIAGHGASGLVFQWSSTIKSPWMCTVMSQFLSRNQLIPQLGSTGLYLTGPLVSRTGAIIVAVLRPVTQTRHSHNLHTYIPSQLTPKYRCPNAHLQLHSHTYTRQHTPNKHIQKGKLVILNDASRAHWFSDHLLLDSKHGHSDIYLEETHSCHIGQSFW